MAEVRNHDESLLRNAHHLSQHVLRLPNLLQRLAQHGVIEGIVRNFLQTGVEIGVNDRDAAVHRPK